MKVSYIAALFALVAVATAQDFVKDSKVQSQNADGTQSEVSNNSGNLVGVNNAAYKGVNVLASHEKGANVRQGQRQ